MTFATRSLLQRSTWAVILASLCIAGCATLKTGHDFDRSASFAGYHTFTIMAREHRGTRNPLVVQRAHDAIQAELIRKGFSYTADATAADFAVDFTIGAHERTDIQTYPGPYADAYWWGYGGWWGRPYWGSEVDVRQYREGTLSIDVFDGRAHKPVWHGWAKKELTSADMENSEAPIRAAVAAVLVGFPPR